MELSNLGPISIQKISKLILEDLKDLPELEFEDENINIPFGIQVLEKALKFEDLEEGLSLVGYFLEDLNWIIEDKYLQIKNS